MSRIYPALDISWSAPPTDAERDLLLATLDDDVPTAVEDTAFGARVFFGTGDARDRAALRLAVELPGLSVTSADVNDEDWAERSQQALTPIRIRNIVVVPVYGTKPGVRPGFSRHHTRVLFIRPSMGFGTGHHASTRLCLELLQQVPLDGASVLDVGTGSGVLAIAAAQSGAATVGAIDTDPDALQSARDNVELNGVEARVSIARSDVAFERSGPWDVVTANLTAGHLLAAADALSALVAGDGRLILGGIQAHERAQVCRAFELLKWSAAAEVEDEGWVGLLLQRPQRPAGDA